MTTRFQYLKISTYWQGRLATKIFCSAVGDVISITTQKNSLAIACKIEHACIDQPSNSIPTYIHVYMYTFNIYIYSLNKIFSRGGNK